MAAAAAGLAGRLPLPPAESATRQGSQHMLQLVPLLSVLMISTVHENLHASACPQVAFPEDMRELHGGHKYENVRPAGLQCSAELRFAWEGLGT